LQAQLTDLTTPRLRLRQWRAADLEHLAALNADPVVMEFMPRCLTRAESDALARQAEAEIAGRGWGLWADFDHPRLAAGHSLRPHVLYRLGRDDWQRGARTGAPP
jgi:RimJ/RimL family protein N-acetyltransferase